MRYWQPRPAARCKTPVDVKRFETDSEKTTKEIYRQYTKISQR